MYKQIKELLEKSGIELSDGLKESEIDKIEQIYEFKFPKSLRGFLSYTLPISVKFYNWRDFSDENIKEIKRAMNYVFEYLKNTILLMKFSQTRAIGIRKNGARCPKTNLASEPLY